MPGLGFTEVLFIFVAALLLFGPRRLPQIGRTLGKGLAEFRKASDELKRTIDAEGIEQDLRQTREAIQAADPRRYLKEAMERDVETGRVARDRRPGTPEAPTGDDAASPDAASAAQPDESLPADGLPADDLPASDLDATDDPSARAEREPELTTETAEADSAVTDSAVTDSAVTKS